MYAKKIGFRSLAVALCIGSTAGLVRASYGTSSARLVIACVTLCVGAICAFAGTR